MDNGVGTKREIINVSRELFYSKGFSKTSIQNIIDNAGIAKGTFYHYFKSKEDLLNQLTEEQVEELYQQLYKIVDSDLSAIEKFNTIFQSASSWKSENISIMKVLVSTVMSDSNLALRHLMLKHTISKMTPVYKSIIDQGVNEGDFTVRDSLYTANFILSSFVTNSEAMSQYLLADNYTEELLTGFKRLMKNFEHTIEILLQLKSGSLHIVDDVVIEKLLKGLLEA